MTTKAEVRAEQHGKETGIILANIENLSKNMDDGFNRVNQRFDNQNCKANTEKINEMHDWYTGYKEIKKTIVQTIIKKVVPSITFIVATCGAVYAFFNK